jgi:hypothetical protein
MWHRSRIDDLGSGRRYLARGALRRATLGVRAPLATDATLAALSAWC